MGLRHGARNVYDLIEAEESEALDLLDSAAECVYSDPADARKLVREAIEAIHRARRIRNEQLTPLVQKAAPPLERRIEELERTVDMLKQAFFKD